MLIYSISYSLCIVYLSILLLEREREKKTFFLFWHSLYITHKQTVYPAWSIRWKATVNNNISFFFVQMLFISTNGRTINFYSWFCQSAKKKTMEKKKSMTTRAVQRRDNDAKREAGWVRGGEFGMEKRIVFDSAHRIRYWWWRRQWGGKSTIWHQFNNIKRAHTHTWLKQSMSLT